MSYQSPSVSLPYLTYFGFAQSCVVLVLNALSLITIGSLLFCIRYRPRRLQTTDFSVSMLTFLATHFIGSALSIPYQLYHIFWWQLPTNRIPDTPIYNTYVLYWIGIPSISYIFLAPVPVTFLTFDRIILLKGLESLRKVLSFVGVFVTVTVYLTNYGIFLLELPLNLRIVAFNEFASTLMLKFKDRPQMYIKMTFGAVNLLSCVYFFSLLTKAKSSNRIKAIKDRAVRMVILCEIFFDILPTYSSTALNLFMGRPAGEYTGELIFFFVAVEASCCGLFYWWIFRRPGPLANILSTTMVHHNFWAFKRHENISKH